MAELQQRVEALEAKIEALEAKINAVELPVLVRAAERECHRIVLS